MPGTGGAMPNVLKLAPSADVAVYSAFTGPPVLLRLAARTAVSAANSTPRAIATTNPKRRASNKCRDIACPPKRTHLVGGHGTGAGARRQPIIHPGSRKRLA